MKHNSTHNSVITSLVLQIVAVLIAYALQILLAHWMRPSAYGIYSTTIAWAGSLAVLAAFGLPYTALRFIAQYSALAKWDNVKGFLRFSYAISAGAGGLAGLLSGAVFLILGHRTHIGYAPVFLCCSWLVPLLTVAFVQSQVCRGFKQIVTASATQIVQPFLLVGICVTALRAGHHLTSTTVCTAYALASVSVLIAQGIVLRRRLPGELTGVSAAFETREWVRVSIPLWLIGGLSIILNRLDILVVSLKLGAKMAGYYNAAMYTADLVPLALAAVNVVAAPAYAGLFAESKKMEMQALATRMAHWIFWPAIVTAMVIFVLSRQIMALFGEDFTAAGPALALLAAGQVVNAGAGSVGFLLSMTGHQNESARVLTWTALINIGLVTAGTTFFGLTGAAFGTAFSMALWNLWLYRLVVKHVGVRASILHAVNSRLP